MRCLYSWLVVAFILMATWSFAHADEPVTTQSLWAGLSTKAKFQGEVVSDLAGGLASGSVGNVLFIGGVQWSAKPHQSSTLVYWGRSAAGRAYPLLRERLPVRGLLAGQPARVAPCRNQL